jgi:hypothetical protein
VRFSIIIVSWNVCDLLRQCLRSLPEGAEVIVVDSASGDGTPEMVAREFPGVHLSASRENLGYSKGNNVGLAAATGEYLFILNPDTVVEPGALDRLGQYLDAHPRVAVVGPQLVYGDGQLQSSRRRFPTPWSAIFESTWLQDYAPPGMLDRLYARDLPPDQAVEVDWVAGAALLLRREAYRQVGGFDEGFFMYSEELDLCKRLKAAGWSIAHEPAGRVIHYEGRSSAQVPAATHIRFNTSKIRYLRKHHGRLAAALVRTVILTQFAWQIVIEGAKWVLGHRRPLRAERVRVYRQVLVHGLRLPNA